MKKIKLFLMLTLFIFLTSCEKNNNIVKNPVDLVKTNLEYVKEITSESIYTKCYKNNDDTYTMYLFSSPVAFEKDDKIIEIDNSIVKSDNSEYIFMNKCNDIKVYFFENGFNIINNIENIKIIFEESKCIEKTNFNNLFGEKVQAIKYKLGKNNLLYVYPTTGGVNFEFEINNKEDIKISIYSENDFEVNDKEKYIIFNGINKYLFYPPINYDEYTMPNFTVSKTKNVFNLSFNFENNYKYCGAFDVYRNKIPDSAVYSNYKENLYLNNYSVIGNSSIFGKGLNYIRFRPSFIFDIDKSNILESEFYIKNLRKNVILKEINLKRVTEQWSSQNITWNSKVNYSEIISTGNYEKGYYVFNVKKFVEDCFSDNMLESLGGVIESKENDYVILASSDNSFYPTVMKIKMAEYPVSVKEKTNINPIN